MVSTAISKPSEGTVLEDGRGGSTRQAVDEKVHSRTHMEYFSVVKSYFCRK